MLPSASPEKKKNNSEEANAKSYSSVQAFLLCWTVIPGLSFESQGPVTSLQHAGRNVGFSPPPTPILI